MCTLFQSLSVKQTHHFFFIWEFPVFPAKPFEHVNSGLQKRAREGVSSSLAVILTHFVVVMIWKTFAVEIMGQWPVTCFPLTWSHFCLWEPAHIVTGVSTLHSSVSRPCKRWTSLLWNQPLLLLVHLLFLRTDHSKSILKDQLQFGDSGILQLKILTQEFGNPINLNLIHNQWSVLEKPGGPAQSHTSVISLELFAYLPIKSLKFIKG